MDEKYFLSEGLAPISSDNETFDKLANKILKQQSKLGKLQNVSIKVKSLSESNLKHLIKIGAMAAVPITTAALYANKQAKKTAFDKYKREYKDLKVKHLDSVNSVVDKNNKKIDELTDGKKKQDAELEKKVAELQKAKEKPRSRRRTMGGKKAITDKDIEKVAGGSDEINKKFKDDYDKIVKANDQQVSSLEAKYKKDKVALKNDQRKRLKADKLRNSLAVGGATSLPFFAAALRKGTKREVLIEAKYKYGTKVFKVYEISKSELEAGIDKIIYKNTVTSLSRLKSAYTNIIKEDVTLEEFKLITLTESELELVMDWL